MVKIHDKKLILVHQARAPLAHAPARAASLLPRQRLCLATQLRSGPPRLRVRLR
jgi:hypothetical protein